MQVVNHPRVFAAGDVVEWNEQKQIPKGQAHAAVIKENVLILLGLSTKKPATYKGSAEMIILTNGKVRSSNHASIFPFPNRNSIDGWYWVLRHSLGDYHRKLVIGSD
jgi:NADH dehydrogenase FAD-containing subunit